MKCGTLPHGLNQDLENGCPKFADFVKCLDQGLSQDLETGCLKLAVVKFLGVQVIKGDHNILRF